MDKSIKLRIETWAEDTIAYTESLSGGSIAEIQKIKLRSGRFFILKTLPHSQKDMLIKERHGLDEIRKTNTILAPQIFLEGETFLLIEYIQPGQLLDRGVFFRKFGQQFAALHRYQATTFGFYEDNFIGATPQLNGPSPSESLNWPEFYFNKRLLVQYELAEKNRYVTSEMNESFLYLENHIEQILSGSKEPPCLLHGDLWSGNFIVDTQENCWLIDPAVYYGHRELDLAMTRLFGGFDPSFYQAYRESFPLAEDYSYREPVYQLYHILNHLNLFGRGYYSQALRLMKSYN